MAKVAPLPSILRANLADIGQNAVAKVKYFRQAEFQAAPDVGHQIQVPSLMITPPKDAGHIDYFQLKVLASAENALSAISKTESLHQKGARQILFSKRNKGSIRRRNKAEQFQHVESEFQRDLREWMRKGK